MVLEISRNGETNGKRRKENKCEFIRREKKVRKNKIKVVLEIRRKGETNGKRRKKKKGEAVKRKKRKLAIRKYKVKEGFSRLGGKERPTE